VKFVLFTLSGLKVKVGGLGVKFVSDLMDVIGSKIYLNHKKPRLPNCTLF